MLALCLPHAISYLVAQHSLSLVLELALADHLTALGRPGAWDPKMQQVQSHDVVMSTDGCCSGDVGFNYDVSR
jgi:hypothetical protein